MTKERRQYGAELRHLTVQISSMNRYSRAAAALVLGVLIVEIGNLTGGTWGGLVIVIGGFAMLYAIVELFRRRF
jgi:hypothetical protein